jgi:hypothetical protein
LFSPWAPSFFLAHFFVKTIFPTTMHPHAHILSTISSFP